MAMASAVDVVAAGGLVVLPTDTVYGIGCDAFNVDAVDALLAAKGRGRDLPPPVLVPNPRTLDGLARDVPDYARALVERFWPGPLTLVVRAQSSLMWDLGDTFGTVAVRMPADEVALELLGAVGPMAVTSANRTGGPPAGTVAEAREQLGDAVALYLDGGERASRAASTIVDCLGDAPRIVRQGQLGQVAIDAAVLATRSAAARAEQVAAAQHDATIAHVEAQQPQAAPGVAADGGHTALEPQRRPAGPEGPRRTGPRVAGYRRRHGR